MAASYKLFRKPLGGSRFLLGVAAQSEAGWRFIPNVSGRKTSRKAHSTWEKCLPRWVGYPDSCESERVEHGCRP